MVLVDVVVEAGVESHGLVAEGNVLKVAGFVAVDFAELGTHKFGAINGYPGNLGVVRCPDRDAGPVGLSPGLSASSCSAETKKKSLFLMMGPPAEKPTVRVKESSTLMVTSPISVPRKS